MIKIDVYPKNAMLDCRIIKQNQIITSIDAEETIIDIHFSKEQISYLITKLERLRRDILFDKCTLEKTEEGMLHTSCGAIALYRRGEMSDVCKYCERHISYGDSLSFKDVQTIKSRQKQ